MNNALRRSAAHVFVQSLAAPELDEIDAHHLLRVMRLRDGEQVSVSDGLGSWRMCAVAHAKLVPQSEIVSVSPHRNPLTIGVALPKHDRPEWIVQKLTEIGIDRIELLQTERSVVRWDSERSARNVQKLRTVAREAAMQSRRVWLPTVNGQNDLLTFLGTSNPESGVAVADPAGEILDRQTHTLLIGPEGGWTAAEVTLVGTSVTLGGNILRVETAALVAATQMVALMHGLW